MDENTWRFAQVVMWLIGLQTTVIIAAFAGLWMATTRKIDGVEKSLEGVNTRLTKIESDVSHLKNDMIEVKTILRMKECCMIQDERKLPKAE